MKNRLLLLACFLMAATCPPAQTPAQTPAQPPEPTVYTGAQILPFLRLYDLKGLGKLIHDATEVPISFAHDAWYKVPFTLMRVEYDNVSLKKDEGGYYVLCPFLPPTLEKLAEARNYQEVLDTLVPPSRSGNEAYVNFLQVPVAIQFLAGDNGTIELTLKAAYLYQDRIVWIECNMSYGQSQKARSLATPFDESEIQIHVSPKYR